MHSMNNIKFTEGSQHALSASTTNILGILWIFLTMFKTLYSLGIIIIWFVQNMLSFYVGK